jgi:hypothetical protein
MKKLFRTVSGKAKDLLEMDMATQGRPAFFRAVVITILLANVALIVYFIINTIKGS